MFINSDWYTWSGALAATANHVDFMTSRDGFGLLNGAVVAMAISEKTAYFYGIRKKL